MKLLSFDAVTPHVSIGVELDGELSFAKTWAAGRRISLDLAPAIVEALRASGLAPPDLDVVAVGTGPGSYTGIRVSLALAKGMAAASGFRLFGISTLETVAFGCGSWPGQICALSSLGGDRLGAALFEGPWDRWKRLRPDQSVLRAEARGVVPQGSLVCGDGADLLQSTAGLNRSPAVNSIPSAQAMLGLTRHYLDCDDNVGLSAEPNYLRASTPEERAAQMEVAS